MLSVLSMDSDNRGKQKDCKIRRRKRIPKCEDWENARSQNLKFFKSSSRHQRPRPNGKQISRKYDFVPRAKTKTGAFYHRNFVLRNVCLGRCCLSKQNFRNLLFQLILVNSISWKSEGRRSTHLGVQLREGFAYAIEKLLCTALHPTLPFYGLILFPTVHGLINKIFTISDNSFESKSK